MLLSPILTGRLPSGMKRSHQQEILGKIVRDYIWANRASFLIDVLCGVLVLATVLWVLAVCLLPDLILSETWGVFSDKIPTRGHQFRFPRRFIDWHRSLSA